MLTADLRSPEWNFSCHGESPMELVFDGIRTRVLSSTVRPHPARVFSCLEQIRVVELEGAVQDKTKAKPPLTLQPSDFQTRACYSFFRNLAIPFGYPRSFRAITFTSTPVSSASQRSSRPFGRAAFWLARQQTYSPFQIRERKQSPRLRNFLR